LQKPQKKLLESIKSTPNFALRLEKTVWENNEWLLAHEKMKALLDKKITIDQFTENEFKILVTIFLPL
jgi:RecG-like helicase